MQYDIARCERALAIKGWTQRVLAEKAGLTPAAVSKFFTGRSVRNDTAKAIITKLGLRVEDVFIGVPVDVPVPLTDEAERHMVDVTRGSARRIARDNR